MLYLVPTPIGNLKDISSRALDALKKADLIACEDTRTTSRLLNFYQIKNKLLSYHQHSKITKIDYLIKELSSGKNIALVSDAGTPAISDPGYLLVNEAHKNNIPVISVPGPSALISALAASGFNLTNFIFLGFLPHKKGRQTILKRIRENKEVFAFFESTHRIIKLLEELVVYIPDREVFLAREISKIHEEYLVGSPEKILEILKNSPEKQRGEFVVVVDK